MEKTHRLKIKWKYTIWIESMKTKAKQNKNILTLLYRCLICIWHLLHINSHFIDIFSNGLQQLSDIFILFFINKQIFTWENWNLNSKWTKKVREKIDILCSELQWFPIQFCWVQCQWQFYCQQNSMDCGSSILINHEILEKNTIQI